MAHDEGAEVALEFALRNPGRTGALALLSPSLEGFSLSPDGAAAAADLRAALKTDPTKAIEEKLFPSAIFDAAREREGIFERIEDIFSALPPGALADSTAFRAPGPLSRDASAPSPPGPSSSSASATWRTGSGARGDRGRHSGGRARAPPRGFTLPAHRGEPGRDAQAHRLLPSRARVRAIGTRGRRSDRSRDRRESSARKERPRTETGAFRPPFPVAPAGASGDRLQEVGVDLRPRQLREKEVHRVDRLDRGESPAELVDLRQLVGRVELLFLARPGGRDVDAREDARSKSPRSRMISQFPVPLNSSKMTSSIRLPVSTRQVATIVSEPPSSWFLAPPKKRRGFSIVRASMPPEENLAAPSLLVVVGAAHPRQRVAEDDDVLSDLHEPLGPLERRLGDGDVVSGGHVGRRSDDLSGDRPLHVGDLLRSLVHEQHEEDDVGVVRAMAFAIVFRRNVFPAFGGATMRQRWPRPIGTTRSRTRPEFSSGPVSILRRRFGSIETPLVELDVPRPVLGRCHPLDRDDLLDHRPLGPPRRRLGLDEQAVFEVLRLHEVLR